MTGMACSAAVTVIARRNDVGVSVTSWVTVPPSGQRPSRSNRSELGPVTSQAER